MTRLKMVSLIIKVVIIIRNLFSTIIASVISVLALFINIIFTFIINKKNNKNQERLLKNRIQADLASSSRIRWIEEVRKASVEYMSSLIDFSKNYADSQKENEFIKCSYCLILYFPVIKGYQSMEKELNRLDNLHVKDVNFTKLYTNASSYVKQDKNEERFISVMNKVINNTENNDDKNPFINSMLKINHSRIINKKLNYNEIYKIINDTTNVISLYLKIEWDRAKKNVY